MRLEKILFWNLLQKDEEEVPEQFPKLPFLPGMHLMRQASNRTACSVKFAYYIRLNSYNLQLEFEIFSS